VIGEEKMFEKNKKVNYMIILLAVLLAAAVIYIALDKYADFRNTQLDSAYRQGQADAQERVLLAIINEVSTKGYVQITDFKANASLVLVPYTPQQQAKQ